MKLNVFVQGAKVAELDSPDGFVHRLLYLPGVDPAHFVSLTMPVRDDPWNWPTLHPFFHVSLPEGFLLTLLKEQLGPHLGARPLDLLAVVGPNLIGRVQVSAGDTLEPAMALASLDPLLHGAASQQVFLELMAQYAASGVSGVVPKFLTPETQALFRKGTVATERHIVKGSSENQPFVALNEHLCMEAARRTGVPVANTVVSDDGQILIVERFDIDPETGRRLGFEDFCSLLGLSPDEKYDSTWERVARLGADYVRPENLLQARTQLAITLLLTFALGNADCHTKNLAFIYDTADDVRIAPVYDMLTILAYDRYAANPPGMSVDGRKTWAMSKALWRYLQQHLGFEPAAQRALVDRVCSAIADTVPLLKDHIRHTAGFDTVGLRMLWEWNEGMKRLRDRRQIAVPDWVESAEADGLQRPRPAEHFAVARIGASPLIAPRPARRRAPPPS
ncbi:MAG TPA: type II toxin-antitoxin system HipA family toxin [Burkholderiaceae bacterium]|nr:type II toxin-antitoxin system HipA family toxin [Burkholderiaceae bacterium]